MRALHVVRRPLLIFGLLLLVPSAGFCYLGWDSIQKDAEHRRAEVERQAQTAVLRRVQEAADSLERLRVREEARHYYEYQEEFLSENLTPGSLAFQANALGRGTDDLRVLMRFQWERGPEAPFPLPVFLKRDREPIADALIKIYGPLLHRHLSEANQVSSLRTGRRVDYSLHMVGANEERGQILEELRVRNAQRIAQNRADPGQQALLQSVDGNGGTPYLENFGRRMGAEPIAVRYTPFRYAAAPRGAAGPPLVAWRLVWIPATHASRRETRRDRWLLQGYALSPGPEFPGDWAAQGNLELGRAHTTGVGRRLALAAASLAAALEAEVATPEGRTEFIVPRSQPFVATDQLVVVGRPDEAALKRRMQSAMRRFLLLVGGLLVIVVLGFFVLMRSVRREILLARRKEDFIAAITHELKTPLTGIRMYAEMIKEGWLTNAEAAERYASRILNETQRLGNLVDQVLDLAALERGVAALSASEGDFGDAVTRAVDLLSVRAGEAGVELQVDIDEAVPRLLFDPKFVRPLVLNLVDNAIKYSGSAGRPDRPVVRVSVFRDADRVCLRVADDGVGIAREARKTLFEPFQRAGDEMTRKAPGVGIGLALVKRYADAHRARIVVESEVGVGTTITVRFPMSGTKIG